MKTRIISAFVALLIVVPLVLLGGVFYEVLIAFASLLALKEIYDLKKSHKSYPNTVKYIGMISLLLIVLSNFKDLTLYSFLCQLYFIKIMSMKCKMQFIY